MINLLYNGTYEPSNSRPRESSTHAWPGERERECEAQRVGVIFNIENIDPRDSTRDLRTSAARETRPSLIFPCCDPRDSSALCRVSRGRVSSRLAGERAER